MSDPGSWGTRPLRERGGPQTPLLRGDGPSCLRRRRTSSGHTILGTSLHLPRLRVGGTVPVRPQAQERLPPETPPLLLAGRPFTDEWREWTRRWGARVVGPGACETSVVCAIKSLVDDPRPSPTPDGGVPPERGRREVWVCRGRRPEDTRAGDPSRRGPIPPRGVHGYEGRVHLDRTGGDRTEGVGIGQET